MDIFSEFAKYFSAPMAALLVFGLLVLREQRKDILAGREREKQLQDELKAQSLLHKADFKEVAEKVSASLLASAQAQAQFSEILRGKQ